MASRFNLLKDPRAVDFIGNIEKAVAKAKVCLQAAQQRQKKYADQHRLDVHYDVGQLVWLSSQHVTLKAVGSCKLLPPWRGPFKASPVNYTLEVPAHYQIHPTFHVSMLRHAYNNGAGVQRPPIIMIEGQEEFEVQEILNHCPAYETRSDTNTHFLVQWQGHGPAYNSWEPASTLKRNAPETLSDYWNELEAAVQAAKPGIL